jgi:hypothetical protein
MTLERLEWFRHDQLAWHRPLSSGTSALLSADIAEETTRTGALHRSF